MKKVLSVFLVLIVSVAATAQQYNNEWIDYNKTYYKFKVGTTGLYRIPQSVLAASNLANSDVSQFQLWRNGQQVPIYTSTPAGVLASGGYIEFWGLANDGKADQPLYRNAADHINDSKSLFTDTAAYFLTVTSTGGNKKLIPVNNNVPVGAIAEPYFMYTSSIYFNESIHLGPYMGAVSEAAISASYEGGEGWTSNEISENTNRSFTQTGLFPYTGTAAPSVMVKMNVVGNSPNSRTVVMKLNGVEVFNTPLSGFGYKKLSATFPISILNGATENLSISNNASVVNNRIKAAMVEITYPRVFNFGGARSFSFKMPASAIARYIEITGFNYTGVPVLYDLTNGKRYAGNIADPAKIKINIDPSLVEADLVLVSDDAAIVKSVTGLETRNFINYESSINQGNYLMITHNAILKSSNGANPVEDYRAYRSSTAGGGYNAKVYMIDQLIDQFAFGIKGSPLSVRNFIRFARNKYAAPLQSIFIIGKGVKYISARNSESLPVTEKLNLISTFGEPSSDILLAAEGASSIPLTPIGRVSVINGDELAIYLDKIRQYEQHFIAAPAITSSAWKKNIIHIVGANDQGLSNTLDGYLQEDKKIVQDTFYGAHVSDFVKTSVVGSQQTMEERLRNELNTGINFLTYFGHSSSTTLQFNLEDPNNYSNQGKYPVFHMMGCNVGDIFILDANRLTSVNTISERYLFAKNRGSIGMMAGTSFGYVGPLQRYNDQLYKTMATEGYGLTLGEMMQKTIIKTYANSGGESELFGRAQNEEFTLNGDPAIRLYQYNKPDYAIHNEMLSVDPALISVAEPFFTIRAKVANLGKAINKDLVVELKRTYPDQTVKVVKRKTIPGVRNLDSVSYQIAITDPLIEKGMNKFTVTIDPDNQIDELFESNNAITKEVFIYEDNIRPVYPHDLSIVNEANVVLYASTGNPLAKARDYIIEIDTTGLFNSSIKETQTKNSLGGAVEFTPAISFKDNTVYYWRVAAVPASATEPPSWNQSSFTYLSGTKMGFSQSHYYQFDNKLNNRITMSPSGLFKFDDLKAAFVVNNALYPYQTASISYSLEVNEKYAQVGFLGSSDPKTLAPNMNSLRFYLIDNKTLKPINNVDLGTSGMYGSYRPIAWNASTILGFFQFDISTTQARKVVMDFLDQIPSGYYVGLTSSQMEPSILPSVWKTDEAMLGANNTLYDKLKNLGFYGIDAVINTAPYVFVYQKDNPVPLGQKVSNDVREKVSVKVTVPISAQDGVLTSSVFTKSNKWEEAVWDGYSLENPSTDDATISVAGINKFGTETVLINNVPVSQKRMDISSISTNDYLGLKLYMNSKDVTNRTPYQLKYWRIYSTPVPEGAIAPNLYFKGKDTVDVGEPYDLGIAFKNISKTPFESLKVKLAVRGKNNTQTLTPVPNTKALIAGDTVKLNVTVDTKSLNGDNILYLEFNPDNAQPEQYQFNNFVNKSFYVRGDVANPYLDVTFDGTHILNRDLVSSKPDILIKLTDDSKYLLLNNPDLIKVQLKYPDGTIKSFDFDDNILTLTPPVERSSSNTANINFKPQLEVDGEYELIIEATDRSNNKAGNVNYRIAFQINSKPMISNLFNYPNPFTTSTAFVFTLTGSEVPQNIRIQILTVTGKIVREIAKSELGSIHIGRNITEFKWDGTDQYGQKLANGVYLYRVLTSLNGKALDKYQAQGDNTDKYFNKGYGKMVLIR